MAAGTGIPAATITELNKYMARRWEAVFLSGHDLTSTAIRTRVPAVWIYRPTPSTRRRWPGPSCKGVFHTTIGSNSDRRRRLEHPTLPGQRRVEHRAELATAHFNTDVLDH
ncbi:hypothetical protein [Gordonia sp. OPL2]|uniref:hypothetical protein n=1 Tax=Gordonia sp. OPL2 TaxID=2486274 RepID=UPI0016552E8B|nr:hypothetical protein [Gordonia sp. OPL2]